MTHKAAVRAGALKTLAQGKNSITAAEQHAKRQDPVSQKRIVRSSAPLAWSKGEGPCDYVEAFKAHKKSEAASERQGAALALELKVIVSPDWVAATGDPKDLHNARIHALVNQAKSWAESWGGKNAVWAVRYDTDERGSGVVDVFLSPVREQRHKNGKSKLVISCRKAKEELLEAERKYDPTLRNSGQAMQSSWARWCQAKLDPRIERGRSKEVTGRDHVHAEVYAQEAERAKEKARQDAKPLLQANEALKEDTRRLENQKFLLVDQIGRLESRKLLHNEQEAMLAKKYTDRISQLEAEVHRLRALFDLLKECVQKFVPNELFSQIYDAFRAAWSGHEANPKRVVKAPEPPPKKKEEEEEDDNDYRPRNGPSF